MDVDGTIWNTTALIVTAWNKAIAECNAPVPKVTEAVIKTQFGKTMNVIADNLFGSRLTGDARAELLKKCYEEENFILKKNNEDISYPGVVQTIKSLSAEIPLYIVSNCQKGYIELMMEKTGITPFITDCECYGNTGNGKAQNIALLVKRNTIAKPVYVGDTQGDCDECRKISVPFMWASYGFGTADFYVAKLSCFSEIKQHL